MSRRVAKIVAKIVALGVEHIEKCIPDINFLAIRRSELVVFSSVSGLLIRELSTSDSQSKHDA